MAVVWRLGSLGGKIPEHHGTTFSTFYHDISAQGWHFAYRPVHSRFVDGDLIPPTRMIVLSFYCTLCIFTTSESGTKVFEKRWHFSRHDASAISGFDMKRVERHLWHLHSLINAIWH